jgi:GNAT superfamily N-acetyltransferase
MELIKVKLNELKAFCDGDLFRAFSPKPLSPLRVASYLNNPRANPDDIVLYLYVENEQPVAFRSILPDSILLQGKETRFGWCSGVWVSPGHRGQKLSQRLLIEVFRDWDDRLMFTNYTKTSEHCNTATGKFRIIKQRTGLRFYLYPNFNRICRGRKHYRYIRPVLPLLTVLTGAVSFVQSLIGTRNRTEHYVELPGLDEECKAHLDQFPATFFDRKARELTWMIQYPWVMPDDHAGFVYPFSYAGIHYRLRVVKIMEGNRFAGFFIYTVVHARMKVICHFVREDQYDRMAATVFALAKKNRIEYLTALDPAMAQRLKKSNRCFAFAKSYTSHIYGSWEVPNENRLLIFDGDGDNCFT